MWDFAHRCALIALVTGSSALAQPGEYTPGWTYFPPDARTRFVYVSSTEGSDVADGASEASPVRSLAAGYALLRDGYPDWLLLKCGDTWSESFPYWLKSANSTSGYMGVGSYGSGARPLISTGQESGIGSATVEPRRGMAVVGLHFAADGSGLGQIAGIGFLENWGNILIEDCLVEKYPNNIVVQEIDPATRLSHVTIRRCIVVDSINTGPGHSQGIFLGSCDDWKIEECVLDLNAANIADLFCHNAYIHESCGPGVFRGNISARACSHGVQMRPGGLCENNLMLQNPLSILVGRSAHTPTVFNTVRNNIVLDARDINPLERRGTGIELSDVTRATVERNIVAHQESGTGNIVALSFTNATNVAVRDNIVYQWTRPGFGYGVAMAWAGSSGGCVVSNNQLQQVLGGLAVNHEQTCPYAPGFSYSGNKYFSINPFDGYPWFANAGSFLTNPEWGTLTGEAGATFGQLTFPDPARTIAQYSVKLGMAPTLEAFLEQARLQSRRNWRPELTAAGAGAWIRAGFGFACRADYNGDGSVNILDFVSFNNGFQVQDIAADVNADGRFNIQDFVAFIQIAAEGC